MEYGPAGIASDGKLPGNEASISILVKAGVLLPTTVKLSMLFKFWGCSYSYTHERMLFLDFGLAVTEINAKKV